MRDTLLIAAAVRDRGRTTTAGTTTPRSSVSVDTEGQSTEPASEASWNVDTGASQQVVEPVGEPVHDDIYYDDDAISNAETILSDDPALSA